LFFLFFLDLRQPQVGNKGLAMECDGTVAGG